jgi:hypothetical protein
MNKMMLKELCDLYPTSSEPKANNKITIQKEKEKKEKEEYESLATCLTRLETERTERNKKSKTKTSRKVANTIKDCTPQEESKKLYFGNNPVGPKDECIYLFKKMKRT